MGLRERLAKLEKKAEHKDGHRETMLVTGRETEDELNRKRRAAARKGLRLLALDM